MFILSNTAFFCLSSHSSFHVPWHIHLVILSLTKNDPSCSFRFLSSILNYGKYVSVCSLLRNWKECSHHSPLFFHRLSFTKESVVTRCMSRLLCTDSSQNKSVGDVLDQTKWKGTPLIDYELLCCEKSRQWGVSNLVLLRAWPDLMGFWDDKIILPATIHVFSFFSGK